MSDALKGKIALVTGASRGIGRAIAVRLARDGAATAINYSSNAEAARKAVAEIESAGGTAFAIQADVGRVSEIVRLFDETIARFGRIDILVNNAGVMFTKPVSITTEAEFDRIFAINVKGTFFAWSASGDAIVRRRQDHQFIQFNDGAVHADLWRLCRHERCCRATHPLVGQGIGASRHHHQRDFSRPDGNGII